MSVEVGLDVWRKKYTYGYNKQTFKLGGGVRLESKERSFIKWV